jgi:hypothetical protein
VERGLWGPRLDRQVHRQLAVGFGGPQAIAGHALLSKTPSPPPSPPPIGGGFWRSASFYKICSSVQNAASTARITREGVRRRSRSPLSARTTSCRIVGSKPKVVAARSRALASAPASDPGACQEECFAMQNFSRFGGQRQINSAYLQVRRRMFMVGGMSDEGGLRLVRLRLAQWSTALLHRLSLPVFRLGCPIRCRNDRSSNGRRTIGQADDD